MKEAAIGRIERSVLLMLYEWEGTEKVIVNIYICVFRFCFSHMFVFAWLYLYQVFALGVFERKQFNSQSLIKIW